MKPEGHGPRCLAAAQHPAEDSGNATSKKGENSVNESTRKTPPQRVAVWLGKSILLACGVLLAANVSLAAEGRKYTLRLASLYMDRHPTSVDTILPWIERVKEKSGGRLVIRYGNPGAFVGEKDVFNAAANGAVDFAMGAASLVPGKFPRLSVAELPGLVTSGEAGSMMTAELLKRFPQIQEKELKGLKVMWMWSSAPMVLDSKQPIMSLEDLAREKTNVWALQSASIIRALGGNPIQTTPGDSYLALQRGQATSLLNAIAPLRSFKLNEVVGYSCNFNLYDSNMLCVMSEISWKRLPPDLQEILLEASADMGILSGRSLDNTTVTEKAALEKEGYQFYDLPPEEAVRWTKALEPLRQDWLDDMKAKGIDEAPQLLEAAIDLGRACSAEVEARNAAR